MSFTRALAVCAVLAIVAPPLAGALAFNDYFKPSDGSEGTPYDFQFQARAGCDPVYYYSLLRGALPPGLALSQSGRVSGTPTAPGVYQFTVQLESYYQGCTSYPSQRDFTIAVAPAKIAAAGVPYSVTFAASTGGTQTWSVASGELPPGLTFSQDGTLSGTPTATGTYTWFVRLNTAPDTHQVVLEVVADRLTVTTRHLAPARAGRLYHARLRAAGGLRPFAWRATGRLPVGIRLDRETGAISGVARRRGTFSLAFSVTDSLGRTSTGSLALKVG